MKHFQYSMIGGLIGLIVGAFFGLVFDSFYTKKSELKIKQTLQAYVFGGIGTIAGISLGLKLAAEDKEIKQEKLKYQQSLVEAECHFCRRIFQYSTLKFKKKEYCDNCISTIKNDYILKCKEINRIVSGIDQLKRHSAINSRLDKVKQIAESMESYENIELNFITKKPSAILKSIEEYRIKLK